MADQKDRTETKAPTWIGYVTSWRVPLIFMLLTVSLLGVMGVLAWQAAGRAGLMHGPVTAALGFGENWSERALAETQQHGQLIVAAIERYREEHDGEFPPSLDALIPDSIPSIETPSVGNQLWQFGPLRNHENEYYLSVQSRYITQPGYYGIEFLQYNSLDKRWATFKSESLLFD